MSTVKNYLSLVKFSHTIFAMPFAIIGCLLAYSHTGYDNIWLGLLKVVLCMVFARNAAMAFNRYTDREIDKKNERTAIREIPSGTISPNSALVFTIVNCILFIATCYFINTLCFYLSPIALLVILGYSYTKRFTALCHLVLGLGLALAPLGAYLAVAGKFDLIPLILSGIVLTWVSGFDIIYALQDEQFDQKNNLKSIPSFFGQKKALIISSGLHVITASLLIYLGSLGAFKHWYWLGAIFFAGSLLYQHRLVGPNKLEKVNLAFFTMNGISSVVFAVFVIADMYTG